MSFGQRLVNGIVKIDFGFGNTLIVFSIESLQPEPAVIINLAVYIVSIVLDEFVKVFVGFWVVEV